MTGYEVEIGKYCYEVICPVKWTVKTLYVFYLGLPFKVKEITIFGYKK